MLDVDRLKKVLSLTYDRFLYSLNNKRWIGSDEDLIAALENCAMGLDGSNRLTELETLRRVCNGCWLRLILSDEPIDLLHDLEYLDALQDIENYNFPWDWKITRDLEFRFP